MDFSAFLRAVEGVPATDVSFDEFRAGSNPDAHYVMWRTWREGAGYDDLLSDVKTDQT
jgi:hypothetical protein